MLYAVLVFIWTFSLLQYTQLKQHSAPPHSCKFKGPLSKWLTWAWSASVLTACHTNQCLSLCLLNTLVLSLFLSLCSRTLPMSLSREKNQQQFASTSTGREETDTKPLQRAEAWETAVTRRGKDRVKGQKSMKLIGLPWVTACQGVSSCPLV